MEQNKSADFQNKPLNFYIVHLFFLKNLYSRYEKNIDLKTFEEKTQACHWIKPSYLEELSKRIAIDKKNGIKNSDGCKLRLSR